MTAAQTHSFFPVDMKLDAIERKIDLIESEVIHRKRKGYGTPETLALWKSIAKDYRTAKALADHVVPTVPPQRA